jgi:sigma-E factor negative regulatory protein RseA
MKQTNTVHEQISALADGELRGAELARVVVAVADSAELRATWQTYHLVGDVLRSGEHASCSDPAAFLSRFQSRLAAEPAVAGIARPTLVAVPEARPMPVQAARPQPVEAANEPVFRWKLVAGVASLAAAAAIGWNWIGAPDGHPVGAQVALQQPSQPASQAVVVAAEQSAPTAPAPQVATVYTPTRVDIGNGSPQVMLRDPRLDQLLEAHQQAGGASQMPSGFLRNATFERPSR